METIHAQHAANLAYSASRQEWIENAARLVRNNVIQFDISTTKQMPFISLENAISEIDFSDAVFAFKCNGNENRLIQTIEELIDDVIYSQIEEMANDFSIGELK